MSDHDLIIAALVIGTAAFVVALWALAVSLLNAEHIRAESKNSAAERILRCITRDRAAFAASEERLAASPGSPEAQRAYNAAALTLAEDYEELCELLVKRRREAESRLSDTYGEEIRAWVEDGPLKDQYRWRVTTYPATAEIWRLTRPTRAASRRAA